VRVSDDRLAQLVDAVGQGASEPEVAWIAAELLARRAGDSPAWKAAIEFRTVDDSAAPMISNAPDADDFPPRGAWEVPK